MANTPLQHDGASPRTGRELVSTLQETSLGAGSPSSSHLLNRAIDGIRSDLDLCATEVADSADALRILTLALASQEAGLARAFSALTAQSGALLSGSRASADFSLCARVVAGSTTAEISPLFGQAVLPARSRQNCLVIERPGEPPAIPDSAAILYAIQAGQTSPGNPPADSAFGEDPYWVWAVDGDDRTFWGVEDPTTTGHMAWVDIQLPGDVSGARRCNELEVVPFPLFGCSLVSVRAEVIGTGWVDLDYSYVTGYNTSTGVVTGLGPFRLCFPRLPIRRFRLGLFVSGFWGLSRVRAMDAVYASSATIAVDFSADSPGTITQVDLLGRDPQVLLSQVVTVNGPSVTATLTSPSPSTTPVLTAIRASW